MAKKKGYAHHFPTLNKPVPHYITFVVLLVIFVVTVILVRKATGVDVPPLEYYATY